MKREIMLAPMAGITDRAFREVCAQCGAQYFFTEMVSVKGLLYSSKKTQALLDSPQDEPAAAQLFGHQPSDMRLAAKIAVQHGARHIDINMGCPTPKIVNNGDGAALIKTPQVAGQMVAAACEAGVPVSIKVRLGWERYPADAAAVIAHAARNGASFASVHGRTVEQQYKGAADWDAIRAIAAAAEIPIVGNGDITSPERAADGIRITPRGIMIGRAALGAPWIFTQIRNFIQNGEQVQVSIQQKMETIALHIDKTARYKSGRIGVLEMRKHMLWYAKRLGINDDAMRQGITSAESLYDMQKLFDAAYQKILTGELR